MDLAFDQRGIDVAPHLCAPEGTLLIQTDRLNAARGPERIEALASRSGTYTLVLPRVGSATQGSVSVRLLARRSATAHDRERAQAAALLAQPSPAEATLLSLQRRYLGWGDLELAALVARRRGLALRDVAATLVRPEADAQRDAAKAALREALAICERSRDYAEQARILGDLAQLEQLEPDAQAARSSFERARDLGEVFDQPSLAIALMGLGDLERNEQRFEHAREHLTEAAKLWRLLGDRRNEARTLTFAGTIATWQGRLDEARAHLTAAESLDREELASGSAEDPQWIEDRGTTQAWLSWIEQMSGRQQAAAAHRALATTYYRLAKSIDGEIWLADNTALALARAGQFEQARAAYRRAMTLTAGQRAERARLIGNLGALEFDDPHGDHELGRRRLREAHRLALEQHDADEVAFCLRKLAEAAAYDGEFAEAKRLSAEAWDTIEGLRARGGSSSQSQPNPDFLAVRQEHAASGVDILIRGARRERAAAGLEEAYRFLERSRARTLRERLWRAPDELDPSEIQRVAREALVDLIAGRRDALAALTTLPLSVDELGKVRSALEEEITRLLERLEALRASSAPAHKPLPPLPPPDLERIRAELLNAGTRILVVTLGDPDQPLHAEIPARVWLIERRQVQVVDVGRAAELHAHAETLRATLSVLRGPSAHQRAQDALQALGAALLPPEISARLVGVERLIVIVEGALQYVPLGSLALPKELSPQREPWITRFDLVYAPSAMTLLELRQRAQRRARAPKTIAVMADPVFSDPNESCAREARTPELHRLAGAVLRGSDTSRDALSEAAVEVGQKHMPRLCRSLDEAAFLRELVPDPGQRFETLGHEATRALARSGRLHDYRLLHFATHAFMPPGAPDRGGLVLSRFDARRQPLDGFLTTADVARLSLQSELVVLSACRTGLGREVRGEGFLGLAQAFMAAGATQVLASLWSVEDEATARLMRLFYEGLAQGADAARALRQAQVAMSREPAYADPFYWAGFVLHGDGGAVERPDQTTTLNAGLFRHTGRAAAARREETAMQDRHAGSASDHASTVSQHAVRADGPHVPGPPPPGPKPDGTLGPESNATSQTPRPQPPDGTKSDGTTLGASWQEVVTGRRHDDATSGTPRPPTPEEKLASNDPAVKVLDDATSGSPKTKPPIIKPENVLGDPYSQP